MVTARRASAVAVAVGGLLVVVGSFLAWAHVTIFFLGIIQRGVDPKGIDFPRGTIVLALGALALVGGIVLAAVRSLAVQRGLWVAVFVCGLAVTAFALFDRVDIDAQAGRAVSGTVDRLAARFPGGANERKLEALVPKFTEVVLRYGINVALSGGAVAALGGAVGLALSSRRVGV